MTIQNLLYITSGFILIGLITVWIVLSFPVKLLIDTIRERFSLSFPGGFARYAVIGGVKGIQVRILWKRNFIPIRESLVTITSWFISKKTEKKEIDKTNERPAQKQGYDWFNLIRREKETLMKVVKSAAGLIINIIRSVRIEYMEGSFSLKDPYYNGLCFAFLAPLCRHNIRIIPNFENNLFFRTKICLIPSKSLMLVLTFIIRLPWGKIYKTVKQAGKQKNAESQTYL
jgi:hypothetical protein